MLKPLPDPFLFFSGELGAEPAGCTVLCPPNGICENGVFMGCKPPFIRKSSRCVLDETIEKNADMIYVEILQKAKLEKGEELCGEHIQGSYNLDNLKKEMQEKHLLPPEAFESAWMNLQDKFLNLHYKSEFTHSTYDHITHFIKYIGEGELSFHCHLMMFWNSIKYYVIALVFLTGVILYLLRKKRLADEHERMAQSLAELARRILFERAQQNPQNGAIAHTHIRDALIDPNSISPRERDDLWSSVKHIIQLDSRVENSVDVIHGIQHEVWEWTAGAFSFPQDSSQVTDLPVEQDDILKRLNDVEGLTQMLDHRPLNQKYPDVYAQRVYRDD